jgi:hypothetical protein
MKAAIRELTEEITGIPSAWLSRLTGTLTAPCAHGCGWAYTSFVVQVSNGDETDSFHGRVANVPRVAVAAGHSAWETDCVAWVPVDYVDMLPLHPAFRAAWNELRGMIERAS